MGGDLAMSGAEETGSGLLRKAGKPSVFFFLSLPSWALFTTIGFVRPKGEEEAFKYGPESGPGPTKRAESNTEPADSPPPAQAEAATQPPPLARWKAAMAGGAGGPEDLGKPELSPLRL